MSNKILHDVKCHTCSDTKCHTIFSVTESVILMKFGELSYFGNFFNFGNVFGDIHPFGLGPEMKGKMGEIRSLLETLGGTLYPRNVFIYIKPGIDNNFC